MNSFIRVSLVHEGRTLWWTGTGFHPDESKAKPFCWEEKDEAQRIAQNYGGTASYGDNKKKLKPLPTSSGCYCHCGQAMSTGDLFRGPICYNRNCSSYGHWC